MDHRTEEILESMIQCLLYPKTQMLITCSDAESAKTAHEQCLSIIKEHECEDVVENVQEVKITFKNGSTIQALHPSVCGDTIRGKRGSIKPLLYDWERIDLSVVDEVLKDIYTIETRFA